MKNIFLFATAAVLISCQPVRSPEWKVEGELMQWHKVTLVLQGPETSEWERENPFLDYRLDVTFTRNGRSMVVPGYYAADGNAGETSAMSGNIWKVHFCPDQPGEWDYSVRFRKGKDIAVKEDTVTGRPVGPDGTTGILEILPTDKEGTDFRAKGRIINGGKGYFVFQGTGESWVKNGTDSPENFLAFEGFDQTLRYEVKERVREGEADRGRNLHRYAPHLTDWKEGDPSWQGGKGKGIIGALNYLASAGVNSVYMLTMNIQGDGDDVWPYTDHNERYRFDCSKLDQWETVFCHMEKLGIMMHLVLQETENECLLDMGYMRIQRRLYLREMIARFGHHLGVTWNLGEENGPAPWTPIGQTDAQRKSMAGYLKNIHPYPCNVVLHTHSDDLKQDEYLTPMLGYPGLDGPSMQIGNPSRVHQRIRKWVQESGNAGRRWIVNLDEIGPAWKGVLPDELDPDHDTVRKECLWGALMSGAGGVEWYFGYAYPHNDLNCEDFRSRALWWRQSAAATGFMAGMPLEELSTHDDLVRPSGPWCLAGEGTCYIVYVPAGTSPVRLRVSTDRPLEVQWFNPLSGMTGQGSILNIQGEGWQYLGDPPGGPSGSDWVAVIR
jgi:hypothetical protein